MVIQRGKRRRDANDGCVVLVGLVRDGTRRSEDGNGLNWAEERGGSRNRDKYKGKNTRLVRSNVIISMKAYASSVQSSPAQLV